MKSLNWRWLALAAFASAILIAINANYNYPLPDKWWVDHSHTTFFLSAYIIWFVYAVDFALHDSKRIILNHTPLFVERLVMGAALSGLYSFVILDRALPLLLFFGSTFWLTFDIAYNYFRGHSLFYVGRTALIDRLTYKIPRVSLLLKIALILLSIHWYIQIF